MADLHANTPLQKLRRNLLLFLQLLLLLVIIGALARPFIPASDLEGQSIVIILDASASMKAADISGTRFGAAKSIALKAVDDLGRGDKMAVISASARIRVASPFTSDKRALAVAINSLECKDTTTHLEDALRLADSLCARKKSAHIVVLSDGAFNPLTDSVSSQAEVTFLGIGRRAENVGIISLGARESLSAGGSREIFVATENFSSSPKSFTIEVSHEGELLDARKQTLSTGSKGGEVFAIPGSAAGMITVKLDLEDDLAADNSASLFLASTRQASVLLITKGNLFLERALVLDPALNVVKAAALPAEPASYDLVIIERVEITDLPPARGYLFINTSSEMALAEMGEPAANPSIVDWRRNHPVTRHLDLGGVRIAEARPAVLKPWGQALAESEEGPLIAAGERKGVRSVYVGWDLLKSDFPLRVAFPIFIANCLEWLVGPSIADKQYVVRPGEAVSFSVPATLKEARITDPLGRTSVAALNGSPLLITDTELAGVYQIEAEGLRRQIAVNLLSRDESDIQPVDQMLIGEKKIAASLGAPRTNKELWRWLVIVALLLATLEWIVYHRRP